jgi:hypothetical protein
MGMLQKSANILGNNAHIQHYEFRLTKHLRVDALQDKVFSPFRFQGYKESVMDFSIPKFLYIYDLFHVLEFLRNKNKIIQGFASFKKLRKAGS